MRRWEKGEHRTHDAVNPSLQLPLYHVAFYFYCRLFFILVFFFSLQESLQQTKEWVYLFGMNPYGGLFLKGQWKDHRQRLDGYWRSLLTLRLGLCLLEIRCDFYTLLIISAVLNHFLRLNLFARTTKMCVIISWLYRSVYLWMSKRELLRYVGSCIFLILCLCNHL